MKKSFVYFKKLNEVIARFAGTQADALEQAAQLIAASLSRGGLLHVMGTGHSHMFAEEFFYRAGGLAAIDPIFDEGLMLHNGAEKSSAFERLPGYAVAVLERHSLLPEDVFLIASNSGRNVVPVEAALYAKEKGLYVVGLTNLTHSRQVASRHASGKKLYELCDIVIDNCGVYGDAMIDLEGAGAMGASSSVIACVTAQMLSLLGAEALLEKGERPEVFLSANVDEGTAANAGIMERYRSRVKAL